MSDTLKNTLNERLAAITEAKSQEDFASNPMQLNEFSGFTYQQYVAGHVEAVALGKSGKTLEELMLRRSRIKNEIKALKDIAGWLKGDDFPSFQSARTSQFHKALDNLVYGKPENCHILWTHAREAQIFLFQNNWAKALEGTEAESGEFRRPADVCAFEFHVSGRHYITFWCHETILELTETQYGWALTSLSLDDSGGFGDMFTLNQVRALCILLEAEAVETEIIRAPHRLNSRREKRGKLPILDHHIIKLANRRRPEPIDGYDGEKRQSPRLHFRRGHWRHFENHKTWIRWQLVGNPDLGFVDKTYVA